MQNRTLNTGALPTGVLLAVLLWTACLLPPRLSAHSIQDETLPNVGLEERLGAKIPLDLTFRDESGRLVRLRDLVTVPTIILPVYYSCTNVCNFLQGGTGERPAGSETDSRERSTGSSP